MSMKNDLKDKCYDGSRIDDKFTVKGRDGFQILTREGWAYSGVYDLYNAKGELLFGGFRQFLKIEKLDLYYFKFGGYWKVVEYSNQNNTYVFEFEEIQSYWLVLDNNFKSFLKLKKGKPHLFDKGFIISNEKRKEYTADWSWNIPKEICLCEMPINYSSFGSAMQPPLI